jgi:hypothetical protein
VNGQLKNLWQAGIALGFEPKNNNFYEARVPGRIFKGWSDWFTNAWVQTNYSKRYSVNTQLLFVPRSLFRSKRYELFLRQNFRFNTKFSISQSIDLQPQTNNAGFAAFSGNDIIFGRRNINAIENIFSLKYSLNDRMVITTRARHYWSKVDYKEYFTLLPDGTLQKNAAFTGNANQNYNIFTVDAVYTWQFAPGSFINVVWKKNAATFDSEINQGYFKNFDNTLSSPQNNNFSIKFIYFLDYLEVRKLLKKKT